MAIGEPYASVEDFKGTPGPKSGRRDDEIADALEAATRLIEREADEFFARDAEAVIRTYWPKFDGKTLELYGDSNNPLCPGIADVTGLQIKVDTDRDGDYADETAWAGSQYLLLPQGANLQPVPGPWRKIYLPEWSTLSDFARGTPVQVTAIFGWPTVPRAAKVLCIEVAKLLMVQGPRATAQIPELDQVVGVSPSAIGALGRLRALLNRPGIVIA